MTGCCFGDLESPQRGEEAIITPYSDRKTRDVLCLVLYILFWVGMLGIAGLSFFIGDPKRIIYGSDGFGNTCGAINTTNGVDLRNRTKLYYLKPYEVLNPRSWVYAETICVEDCPRETNICSAAEFPCSNPQAYRCPYYVSAEDDLYGTLQGVAPLSTQYWDALNTTSLKECSSQSLDSARAALLRFADTLTEDRATNFSSSVFDTNSIKGLMQHSSCGEALQHRSALGQGPCYPVWVNTTDVFNRCIPHFHESTLESMGAIVGTEVSDALQAVWDATRIERMLRDIIRGWPIILGLGVILPVVLAVMWLILMRFLGGLMIWATVILVNAALLFCAFLCFSLAGMIGKAGAGGAWLEAKLPEELGPVESDQKVWEITAYCVCALEVLVLLVTFLLARRMKIGIAVVKVGIESIGTMPSLVAFPFFPILAEAIFLFGWVVVSAFLWSTGSVMFAPDVEPMPTIQSEGIVQMVARTANVTLPSLPSFEEANIVTANAGSVAGVSPTPVVASPPSVLSTMPEEDCSSGRCAYVQELIPMDWYLQYWPYLVAYHIFGLFWTTQFISGCNTVIIAGAVSNFYWNGGTRGGARSNQSPMLWALGTTVCCHLGSVALGSFILALISFVRVLLEYVHRKTRESQQVAGGQWLCNCIRCCCWCWQKVMDLINKNTLIMVGIKGKGYCVSALHGAALMISNLVQVAVVNLVSAFLIWVGKLLVIASCAILAILTCNLAIFSDPAKHPNTFLSGPVAPVAATVVAAYLIVDIYFQVYDVVIGTVLLAFCQDCEQHGGRPRYAPPMLAAAVGVAKAAEAEKNEGAVQLTQRPLVSSQPVRSPQLARGGV
uniref:Choline transporter-like protein n=1 Tax=Tetraselmis chuii TaxID=63592 RepID=A0A7S1WZW3_9CHLO|mmetsp:Transcript_15977/g.28416  ORF Transcript_15977/g.28416 Transcript_15977/m.28416 type:complete len:837 (+) Transcript_15977:406-2916(+)